MKFAQILLLLAFAQSFALMSTDADAHKPETIISSDQNPDSQGLVFKLNVYPAVTRRKGNGIVVFTECQNRDAVLKHAQEINQSLEVLGTPGGVILRIPKKIPPKGNNQKCSQEIYLLSISALPQTVSELALKEAMLPFATPTAIIFFRDKVQNDEKAKLEQEKDIFLSALLHEVNAPEPSSRAKPFY